MWDGEEEDTIKRKTLAWHVNVLMLCVQKKVRGVGLGWGLGWRQYQVVTATSPSFDSMVDSPL